MEDARTRRVPIEKSGFINAAARALLKERWNFSPDDATMFFEREKREISIPDTRKQARRFIARDKRRFWRLYYIKKDIAQILLA